MNFNEYQIKALQTAVYPDIGNNLIYPVLGLTNEAGEVAGKLKKTIRDGNDLNDIAAELGDVLWYLALCAHELGIGLDEIAEHNIMKLAIRQKRGTLKGSGDNR